MPSDIPIPKLGDFKKESAELLAKLLEDLKAHNDEHSTGTQMGKTLGRFLAGVIDDEKPDMQKSQVDTTLEAAQGARAGLAELNTKHKKVLDRFGLKLTHQAGEGLKHGLPSGPISMKIDNIHAFLRYAQSIPAAHDEKNGVPKIYETLRDVVEGQIATIAFAHPSPEEKGLLENIDPLVDAFKRIAPALDISRLQHFADYHKTDRLEQYLTVEREGLWTKPGSGFGPADWVRDILPRGLDERWSAAIKVLREQESLGNAGVGKELREHLIMCRNRAEEQLPALSWPDEGKDALQEVLEKYKVELER